VTTADPAASEPAAWEERCQRCGRTFPLLTPVWHCDCGGLVDLVGPRPRRLLADPAAWSMWRYAPTMPPIEGWEAVTLGEGMTPLVALTDTTVAKLDFCNPTLSFKDRGAAVLVAGAAASGVDRVVVDSSGNAGTAMAAYGARAGIAVEVWVPGGTSPKKTAAMRAHGADVRVVEGDRTAAGVAAARRVDETGAFYASHVYQPLFTQGTKTVFLELWEQLGGRLPDTIVVPAGNGTLVIGAGLAFDDLIGLGLVATAPRLVAVQARRCAPLAGRPVEGPTVAEGIAIPAPPRAEQVRRVVAGTGGEIVTVTDDAILAGQADLAARGIWVEPTAAAAWAACRDGAVAPPGASVGLVLCGAGCKSG
jgi:threonine synthase